MSTPKPFFCRLEYLTPKGWTVGHAGISLLNPARYVERLSDRDKFGRCTVLDPTTLLPTDEVYVSPNCPDDPSVLVPDPPYRVPRMPAEDEECSFCLGTICEDATTPGACLL